MREDRVSESSKSHRIGRRLRTMAAVTGIVLAASVATGQPALAQDSGGDALPQITAEMAKVALAQGKVPTNAVRAKANLPAPGAYGAPFQKPLSTRSATPYIVGGTVANPADFPSVVGIETLFLAPDETGTPVWWISTCTGTVISPTKVLTAAHCTTGMAFGTTVVIAGRAQLDTDTGGFVAAVATTWADQQFNLAALNEGTADVPVHDVSVITLKTALPAAYPPISLTAQGDNTPYAEGTPATIVGYGVSDSSASDSGILRQATVQMQSNTTCSTAMPGYDAQSMICAGLPAGGVDSCFGDSGGPIIVNGVETGITDWGSGFCGAAGTYGVYERLSFYRAAIDQAVQIRPLVNLDWSGDGHTDLFGRLSNGDLIEYSGSGFLNDGFNGFAGWGTVGTGWNAYSKLFRVTNWNGDDTPSIFAMTSGGALYQYRSDGAGTIITPRSLIGTGWNVYTDIMVTNNWTGSGRPNVMGRKSNGDLFLYESDGQGGWTNGGIGIKIGQGWNIFNTVLTPGDWRGNGQSLIGRTTAGDLLLYESNGSGGWKNNGIGIKIGQGWNVFTIFLSPGDWNGDNLQDMIGIRSSGTLSLYESDGSGNWLTPLGVQIGAGWNAFTTVF
jgi:Trypsin